MKFINKSLLTIMYQSIKYLSIGLLVASFSLSSAEAKGSGKGGGKGHKPTAHGKAGKITKGHSKGPTKVFKPKHKGHAADLWQPDFHVDRARHFVLQNHLGGQKPLPPGIRKNLMRGKPLPPGIARTRLPHSFLSTLPYREGYEWQAYGSDLVLVSRATQLVAQVLMGALR